MHSSHHRLSEPVPLAVLAPSPEARVGDADRERTVALLGDAAAAGYLRLDELDQRLSAAWSATTVGQLSAVENDLPEQLLRARARRETAARARDLARASLGPRLRSYAALMLLLTSIWFIVGLTAGAWYPWPLWPALGWGIGLAAHLRAAQGHRTN